MAYLAVFTPQGLPLRHELTGAAVVGRQLGSDIWLDDANISRRHCRIEQVEGEWVLSDLGSTNGTWLERAQVDRHVLRDGDTFYVGEARLAFHSGVHVAHRPADPNEASRGRRMFEGQSDPADSTIDESVVLPVARATLAGQRSQDAKPAARPSLAFRRPPARPIVRDATSRGWVGAVVSRFRAR